MIFFGGWGEGVVVGGGVFLVGGGSVFDDMGGVCTGDEVMLTSPRCTAMCPPPLPPEGQRGAD